MKKGTIVTVICAVLICLSLILAGCEGSTSSANTQAAAGGKDPSEVWVMRVGDQDIYLNEVNFYAYSFAKNFALGEDTDLTAPYSTDYPTWDDAYKAQLLLQIRQSKILYIKAQEQGITLTDDEMDQVAESVTTFKNGCGEGVLDQYGIDDDLLTEMYQEISMIRKLEDGIKEESSYEAVDYGSYYNLVFLTVELDEAGNAVLDEGGAYVKLSQSEQDAQREKAEEVLARLQEGEKPEDLIEEYDLADTSGLLRASTDSMSETFGLKDGETSDIIENDFGYTIVQIVKLHDEEYSESVNSYGESTAGSSAVEKQEQEWFDAFVITEEDLDSDVWGAFTFADFI